MTVLQARAKMTWPEDRPRMYKGDLIRIREARGKAGKPVWVVEHLDGRTIAARPFGRFPRKFVGVMVK